MKDFGRRVLREGLVAGLIGYAIVALFFLAMNVVQGRPPFETAEFIGRALFYGGAGAETTGQAGPILAYNGVHLLLFIAFGVFTAWLVAKSEQGPQLWYLALTVHVFVLAHMLGGLLVFVDLLGGSVTPVTVVVSGILASVAMVYYLWRAHPRLRAEVRTYDDQPI